MFQKKIPFGRIIPRFFLRKCRIWPFLNYLHDSNSIFWAQGIKSEGVLGRTVLMMNSLHLAIHFCGDLVHWRSRIVIVLVFSSCQSGLTSGVCIHMAATSLTMLRLDRDRDQSAHLPVFLHLRTTNLSGPSSVMRSEQAQQRRFERRHNKERMQKRRS